MWVRLVDPAVAVVPSRPRQGCVRGGPGTGPRMCPGGRAACTLSGMGKASRRKKVANPAARAAYRAPIPFVDRPYEGLPAEGELVAMREIIPAATLGARTTAEHGGVEFDLVTLLPDGNPAMVRPDGRILVALQTRFHSGDLSHDAGGALLAAAARADAHEDGIVTFDVRDPAPRLQDLVDPASFAPMVIQEDFGYWFDPEAEMTHEMEHALAQNRDEIVPTAEVPGVPGMYWCAMNRNFVRYVTDIDESKLFTALARLQAAGTASVGEGSRFVGAFRACGLAIPVFELPDRQGAQEVAAGAGQLVSALEAALEISDPLTDAERRARQGLVSRQVTIR